VHNQDESDVDCGGSCGAICPDGSDCQVDNDCLGRFCDGGLCDTAACDDGVMNGDEEQEDCGGSCPACPTCDDGIMNGDEEGTDCGGSCPSCGDCGPTAYEAEAMFHSTGGSAPDGWNLWDNGYIATTHAFADEPATLTVRARGDQALGVWPHLVVSVGGTVVGDTFVTSSTFADYAFELVATEGNQEVRLAFDNDYYAPPQHDRNLYVDKLTVECSDGCNTGAQDGFESDVDCGGTVCPGCPDGSSCDADTDCLSGECSGGECTTPSFSYGFESGTQGWTLTESPATTTTTTSLLEYQGFKSLKVNVSGSGDPRVWVSPPEPVPAGATVTYHVYIPSSAPVSAVQPYVADATWQWSDSWNPITSGMKGSWQTFTVQVSAAAGTPVQEVGLKFYLSGSWAGALYVDEVGW
jgi:hypothetical protein